MGKGHRFEPAIIGLILSYKCQSACSHCLYNCGPEWQDWITPEDIKAAVTATMAWEYPYQIHITGGEPFLNYSLLLLAVHIVAEKNIPCYVETNAGWCLQESLVVHKFKQLKDSGLNGLHISCSPFHAEKIPPIRTFTAISAAYKVFGPHRITIYLPEWMKLISKFGLETPIPLEHYIQNLGPKTAGKLFWNGYGLISGGRSGYRLGHLTDKKPANYFKNQSCQDEIVFASHAQLDPYGNYLAGNCGGISLGNWHDFPGLLNELMENELPPIVSILTIGGPYRLYQYALKNFGYKEKNEGYVGKCHLCVDLRKHLSSISDFPELAPRTFYDLL